MNYLEGYFCVFKHMLVLFLTIIMLYIIIITFNLITLWSEMISMALVL